MHEDFRRCPWKQQGKPLRISPLNSTGFLGVVSVSGFFELRLANAFLNVAVCYVIEDVCLNVQIAAK